MSLEADNKAPLPGTKEHARACTVLVFHKYSQDGRSTETLTLSYDPKRRMDLFLLEQILDTSNVVEWYRSYDEFGKRIPCSIDTVSKRR